jgi:hypothetical protein
VPPAALADRCLEVHFTFTSGAHAAVVDAVASHPDDVVVSFKNTPAPLLPAFPHKSPHWPRRDAERVATQRDSLRRQRAAAESGPS